MIQVRADVMNEDCIAIAVSLSSKASASWLGSTCMYLILCEAMSVAQLDIQPVHGANEGGVFFILLFNLPLFNTAAPCWSFESDD